MIGLGVGSVRTMRPRLCVDEIAEYEGEAKEEEEEAEEYGLLLDLELLLVPLLLLGFAKVFS